MFLSIWRWLVGSSPEPKECQHFFGLYEVKERYSRTVNINGPKINKVATEIVVLQETTCMKCGYIKQVADVIEL